MRIPGLLTSLLLGLLLLPLAACNFADKLEKFSQDSTFSKGYISGNSPKRPSRWDSRISGPVTSAGNSRRALTNTEIYEAEGSSNSTRGGTGENARVGKKGEVTLNFVNAQLREVVDVILGDILDQNYTMSDSVQGTVTTRTNVPIPNEDLIPVLENLLALNGASIVNTSGIWHVVPYDETRKLANVVVTPNRNANSEGFGIHFIRLEYAPVSSVIGIVTNQVNPGRQITADKNHNMIIFVGPLQEAKAIESMVSVLDIDLLSNKSFALIPVNVANVSDVVDDLKAAFDGDAANAIQFVAIERISAVMAISRNKKYLKTAQKWVSRFDRADERGTRQVFVYYVKNGRATELAGIMSELFDGAKKQAKGNTVAPGLEPVEISQNGGDELEPLRAAIQRSRGQETSNLPTIVADERNNALVIKATAADYRNIEAVLSRLDIVPLQVLIEVIVAEVSLDGKLEFGVEWYFKSGNFSQIFSTLASGAVSNSFPGFGFSFETVDANVVLNALDSVTDVDVISSPKIMVLDNQSARLQVGDQVPVVTRTAVSAGTPDAPIVNSVELIDTGVILEVTPTVNTGGLVSLKVVQEVSEATTTVTSDIDSPTIQKRKIESTLAVQSGETVALAGMMRDRSENGDLGVPGLKKLPVIGGLFRSRKNKNKRTELIVLITPRVVRDPNEMRQLTNELRDSLSSVSKF